MARHELSDEQWERIRDLLPPPSPRGRPRRDPRQVLNGMLWILRTGAPWRDLPKRYGSYQTVHRTFGAWRSKGVLQRVVEGLQGQLNEAGEIDWLLWCVDGSSVRAARCATGARRQGGRYPGNRRITPSVALEAD